MDKKLAKHRIEKAEICLLEAKTLSDSKHFSGAVNRAYYTIFHSMRSVQGLENIEFSKHSAVIAHFRNTYVRTNQFDKHVSKIISWLSEARNKSDYDDFFILTKDDAKEKIEYAEYFLKEVKAYLKKLGI